MTIAVSDTGVGRELFRGRLAMPVSAPVPGMNFSGEETSGELYELYSKKRARLPKMLRLLKGWGDTFVNVNSPEAQ